MIPVWVRTFVSVVQAVKTLYDLIPRKKVASFKKAFKTWYNKG